MGSLYLGPYRWPIAPPLRVIQAGRGHIAVFFSQEDSTPEALELLEKVVTSIGLQKKEATLVVVRTVLTSQHLSLFAEPVLWVLGQLLPDKKTGVYDPLTGQPLSPPQTFPRQGPYLYILPSLSEMIAHPEAKKLTWRWIHTLASASSK
ncbi:MAG: hypothetical protein N3E49_05580 [Bacteroidia bacterium]|nr:hypothetical protein [Bacteroidia bacterium]